MKESSQLFLDSLTLRYPKKTALISIIVFLITFALFASLSPNALHNGDAALYAQQVMNHDFSRTTIHLGYFTLGVAFTLPLPIPVDDALNLMNCFFGALSVVLIYLMSLTLFKKQSPALISCLFLIVNFIFVYNSIYTEIYISQTFFLLLSVQFWLRNRPCLTGLSFALAFLISPSTILALPLFILLRPDFRSLLKLCAIAFVISIAALFPHLNDYLYSGSGLLGAVKHRFILKKAVLKESRELFYAFYAAIPFVIAGITGVVTQKRLRIFGAALFSLWLMNFIFGETTGDVPIQLPFYTFLSLVGGFGFTTFFFYSVDENRGKYLWFPLIISLIITFAMAFTAAAGTHAQLSLNTILLFAFAIVLYTITAIILQKTNLRNKHTRSFMIGTILIICTGLNAYLTFNHISDSNKKLIAYRNTMIELNQTADANAIVIGNFSKGVLFEHYNYHSYLTGRWINTEWLFGIGSWGKENQPRAKEQLQDAISSGREIWLLSEDCEPLFPDLEKANYSIKPFKSVYRARIRKQRME